MSTVDNLNEVEQKVFTLLLIQSCLEYAKNNKTSFEAVLIEALIPGDGKQSFTDMICYNTKLLYDNGLINGDVKLIYDTEEIEDESKNISVIFSTLDVESISVKGKTYLKTKEIMSVTKKFIDKSKPLLTNITNKVLNEETNKVFDDFNITLNVNF